MKLSYHTYFILDIPDTMLKSHIEIHFNDINDVNDVNNVIVNIDKKYDHNYNRSMYITKSLNHTFLTSFISFSFG